MGTILKYKPKISQESNYRVFDDRYRLLSILGQGRESVVYRGVKLPDPHPASGSVEANSVYALKVFTRKTKDPELKVAQIMREASAMLSCRHENIVQLYDVVTLGDLCYLVMEYIDGGNLAAALSQKHGPAVPQLALLLTIQTLNGLASVHDAGIVHRDIKPANILVSKQGAIKLADFSIARLPSGPGCAGEESLGIGTFDYLAPECLEGSTSSPASDIYAVAVTTYQLITNHLPFDGDSLTEKIDKKMENKYLPIRHFVKDVPRGLESLIRQGLMVNPAERYQSVSEFQTAIESFIKSIKDPKYRQASVLIKAMQEHNKSQTDNNVFDISDASAYSLGKTKQDPKQDKSYPPRWDPSKENEAARALTQLHTPEDAALDRDLNLIARSANRRYSLIHTVPMLILAFVLLAGTIHYYPAIVPSRVKEAAVVFNSAVSHYISNISSSTAIKAFDVLTPATSAETNVPTQQSAVAALAQGQHTLAFSDLEAKPVMLTVRRIHGSDQVIMVLHLPNATPQLVPASAFHNNQEIVHHDLGYSLSLSVSNIDPTSGLPVGGQYIEGQSGKNGSWKIQP